ncbi:MAG: S-methyl-5-thioribose-1-phosphate isomerase, partial [Acidimicrobiia bacterium]
VALAARQWPGDPARVRKEADRIRAARPTAVNLAWGVDRALARLTQGPQAVLEEALRLLEEDAAINRRIGERGARYLSELGLDRVTVLTHCNTGALATVEWGTALGVVHRLHDEGRLDEVFATETRPLLQGARLTAWELGEMGVRYRLVADSAAATVLARHLADVVIVGADRVVANGDVANKVGTYPIALAARRAGIPFVVAAPESTIDSATPSGADVQIEMRDPEEITSLGGVRTAPRDARALNFAFDVTPADLVEAIITDRRVIRPARGERPDRPE